MSRARGTVCAEANVACAVGGVVRGIRALIRARSRRSDATVVLLSPLPLKYRYTTWVRRLVPRDWSQERLARTRLLNNQYRR